MTRNIFFFLQLITLILTLIANSYAEELLIIPIKKPILDKITKEQKLIQGILRPKSKPIVKTLNYELSKTVIIPQIKPSKKIEKKETKKIEKKNNKEKNVVKKDDNRKKGNKRNKRNKNVCVSESNRRKKRKQRLVKQSL